MGRTFLSVSFFLGPAASCVSNPHDGLLVVYPPHHDRRRAPQNRAPSTAGKEVGVT